MYDQNDPKFKEVVKKELLNLRTLFDSMMSIYESDFNYIKKSLQKEDTIDPMNPMSLPHNLIIFMMLNPIKKFNTEFDKIKENCDKIYYDMFKTYSENQNALLSYYDVIHEYNNLDVKSKKFHNITQDRIPVEFLKYNSYIFSYVRHSSEKPFDPLNAVLDLRRIQFSFQESIKLFTKDLLEITNIYLFDKSKEENEKI